MVKYKVSVIIPIYNAQNTIKRCIDSVINQTIGFSNIELILYDDNSTDNTRKILKEYSEKYDNIVLILSDENSGYPGKGRNEGIKKATADYVMFMDHDDRMKENMCETFYNEIVFEDADIVSSSYEYVDNISSGIFSRNVTGGISLNDKTIFSDENIFDYVDVAIWNKIYKKSTITQNNVKYPENSLAEDVYFVYYLLIYVKKIVHLKNFVGYEWRSLDSSTSHSTSYDKIKSAIVTDYKILNEYKIRKIEANYTHMFSNKMEYPLKMIITSDGILDDKEQTKELLNCIYFFDKALNFDDSNLCRVFRYANNFIMKKEFKLAIAYLRLISFFYKHSSKLRNFYRVIRPKLG